MFLFNNFNNVTICDVIGQIQGKNLTFSKEGQNFPGRSYFDIFPGKCKISKITVLNCYNT